MFYILWKISKFTFLPISSQPRAPELVLWSRMNNSTPMSIFPSVQVRQQPTLDSFVTIRKQGSRTPWPRHLARKHTYR